jgi:hypothetical protein
LSSVDWQGIGTTFFLSLLELIASVVKFNETLILSWSPW